MTKIITWYKLDVEEHQMIYKEVEFKYDAASISLEKYNSFLKKSKYTRKFIVSGTDHFYGNSLYKNTFYRIREDNMNYQLTYKAKTISQNNFIRTEHNLDLKDDNKDKAEAYVTDLGYEYRGSLFKTSFVYLYDYYVVAYYIVYDTNHNQIGKFIEIEIKEDYPWFSEEQMFNELVLLEKMHKELGIKKSARLNESLFEMYIKEKV